MIEPKEITVNEKQFVICKFPALSGREIIAEYPVTSIPKLGNYKANEEVLLKLMSYVSLPCEEGKPPLFLNTRVLIDNHIKDWEMLRKIEWEVLQYNCSFFQNGLASNFLQEVAQNIPEWITKILTHLSEQSLQKEKQHSTN